MVDDRWIKFNHSNNLKQHDIFTNYHDTPSHLPKLYPHHNGVRSIPYSFYINTSLVITPLSTNNCEEGQWHHIKKQLSSSSNCNTAIHDI